MDNTFKDKMLRAIEDALVYIHLKLDEEALIDIYSNEDTLYETVLSSKYAGIYSIYELISIYKDGDIYYVKGVDTNDKSEAVFEIRDIEPTTICDIADRI